METAKSSSFSAGQPVSNAKNRSSRANGNVSQGSKPTREQIASLACQLYLESGCQEGRDAENWLRAEQMLRELAASGRPQEGSKPENGNKQRSSPQQA
jgi:hypothetical protein